MKMGKISIYFSVVCFTTNWRLTETIARKRKWSHSPTDSPVFERSLPSKLPIAYQLTNCKLQHCHLNGSHQIWWPTYLLHTQFLSPFFINSPWTFLICACNATRGKTPQTLAPQKCLLQVCPTHSGKFLKLSTINLLPHKVVLWTKWTMHVLYYGVLRNRSWPQRVTDIEGNWGEWWRPALCHLSPSHLSFLLAIPSALATQTPC